MVGGADGEHTRPRVFRAAPSLPGGRKDHVSHEVETTPTLSPSKFPARAPETARGGACAPRKFKP